MADKEREEIKDDDIPGDESDGGGEQQSSPAVKKKFIFILIPIVVLIFGAAVLYFSGIMDGFFGDKPDQEQTAGTDEKSAEKAKGGAAEGDAANASAGETAADVYFDLPDILVNLNSGTKKQVYLKVSVSLALPDAETSSKVEREMPRILDSFQIYLRELTVEEVQASAGMYRLKEELVERINRIISPSRVNDVLFKEMLIQ